MKITTTIKDVKFVAENGKLLLTEAPANMTGCRLATIQRLHKLEIDTLIELSNRVTEVAEITPKEIKSAVAYVYLMSLYTGDKMQFLASFFLSECETVPSLDTLEKKFDAYCLEMFGDETI